MAKVINFYSFALFLYKCIATAPKMILGIHIARSGGRLWLEERTFSTSKEKMNVKANEIPTARFCPIPPLRFCEESDNAKIDKMKIDTGIEVRWWSSFR